MKIIITGGGGFLGSQLAQKLLERGTWNSQPITEMVLLDAFFREAPTDARVTMVLTPADGAANSTSVRANLSHKHLVQKLKSHNHINTISQNG
jgi:nucleoside-diphosphate-sugar epimerase